MKHQSEVAQRRQEVGTSGQAGHVVAQVVTFAFPKAFTAATDTLEVAMLPARNQLLSAEVFSTLPATNTATMKLMDGEFGDTVEERALTGDTILTGDVQAAPVNATRAACLAIAKQDKNTGIGLSLSADVAAGAGELTVVLTYAA